MKQLMQDFVLGTDGFQIKPIRALIVEDSVLQRRILKSALAKWGYEVFEADSGLEALKICRECPPDIVISDWMMPGMDGLEFCRNFRAMKRDSYGYFILLTSKSEKGEVAQGLDSGADDFLTKPVNQTELRARLSAGERIIGMERQLQAQNKVIGDTLAELTELHDAMDRDLQQARRIQESLLPPPETEVSGSRISCLLQSCGHVGGDLVGMFDAGSNQIGMFNIDVSGHGITSALMTARISGYLSERFLDQNIALVENYAGTRMIRQPAEVAALLNERLLVDHGVDQYFTMLFASIDLTTGRARLCQAGHPDTIIIRKSGEIEHKGEGGFPIGLLDDVKFSQFDIKLERGDRLLFCSDGFSEAVLDGGAYLGQDGLNALIRDNIRLTGQAFLNCLYSDLRKRLPQGDSLDDDVSAILLEYKSA